MIATYILLANVNIPAHTGSAFPDNQFAYIIGVIVAGFILAYLIYSLLKPEKF
jgi:K+-transporting ATPase KdpF subunit